MTDQPTARPRRRSSGSDAAAAFGRAFATRDTTTPPAVEDDQTTPAPPTPASSRKPLPSSTDDRPSKFTVLLDGQAAADFDGLALSARRQLGRRVEKSELVRVLIALAADDPSLLGQIVDELRRRAE